MVILHEENLLRVKSSIDMLVILHRNLPHTKDKYDIIFGAQRAFIIL